MDNEFDFKEFVENLIIEAIKSPDIALVLEEACYNPDLEEKISKVEDKIADLENDTVQVSEMDSLEDRLDKLQARLDKFEKYLPILEAMEKAKEKSAPRDNFGRRVSAYDLPEAAKRHNPNWGR